MFFVTNSISANIGGNIGTFLEQEPGPKFGNLRQDIVKQIVELIRIIINAACSGGGSTRFKKVPESMNIKLFTGDSIEDIKHVASMGKYRKPTSQLLVPPVNNMQMRPAYPSQTMQSTQIQQQIESGNDKIRKLQEEVKAVYLTNTIKNEEIRNLRVRLKKQSEMIQNMINTFGSICHHTFRHNMNFQLPDAAFAGAGGKKMKTIYIIQHARYLNEQRNAQMSANQSLATQQSSVSQQLSIYQQSEQNENENENESDEDVLFQIEDEKAHIENDEECEGGPTANEMRSSFEGELQQDNEDVEFYDPDFLPDEILATMDLPVNVARPDINVNDGNNEDDAQMICID